MYADSVANDLPDRAIVLQLIKLEIDIRKYQMKLIDILSQYWSI